MASNPALKWEQLAGKFYSTHEYDYELERDGREIDFDSSVVALAPGGGAVAVTDDEHKLVAMGNAARQMSIGVFSGSGNLIRRLPWDMGRIRGLGWTTEGEKLVVVSDQGSVRVYYDFHGNFNQFSLGLDAETAGVKETKFWNSGFVCLLNNGQFIGVLRAHSESPVPRKLAEPVTEKIHSWCIIPPEVSMSRGVEVVASTEQGLMTLDSLDSSTKKFDKKAEVQPVFNGLTVSPSGHHMALVGNTHVTMGDVSLDRIYGKYELEENVDQPIRTLCWLGEDAVAISFGDEVSLVGRENGSQLTLYYNGDGAVEIRGEDDGSIRIMGNNSHHLFSRVCDAALSIFRIGSVAPAAILLDCVTHLDKQSPRAWENLEIIGPDLQTAVDNCILAAGNEDSPSLQKRLLRAAAFGKSALDIYNSERFVQVCDDLRVLNSVRQSEVGLCLSYQQYKLLGPKKLIQRLLLRNLHQLCFNIAGVLKYPVSAIEVNWACSKIFHSPESTDEELYKAIMNRLKDRRGVSFCEIARQAAQDGRVRLATQLTEQEKDAYKQVPLLMELGDDRLALEKAVECRSYDLITLVQLHLQDTLSMAQLYKLIREFPIASHVYENNAKVNSKEALEQYYYQSDRQTDSANCVYLNALGQNLNSEKLEGFRKAASMYSEHGSVGDAAIIEEQSKLLKLQEQLERDYECNFLGLSVTDTIHNLLVMGQASKALKIKTDFKISERKWTWLKLNAYVERRDWTGLMEFATSRRSPIGYVPFYDACMAAGSKRNAAEYITMTALDADVDERVQMALKADDVSKAAKEAFGGKRGDLLEELESKASGATVEEIQGMIEELRLAQK
ncbi:Vps16, C-terminal region-domain-containing protein [Yarrowia lipolytica]|uniref:Probable vacuolar protein sorting-associated protein 16 homolog n=1 Tax=Yarrowia lipolytica TaxID=4952 RepID=A0A1D8N3K7_YARLL|nr:hypothetical protein YALI1_A03803g [Yarrowia lipolytica]KAB8284217.1 Vps16, C-terminal region-domain-containing protein [Yarrowia lipolytica]KAE8173130.1 Vps16, C-terminal region-domain-containing protein [Yarrowia lipolytica]KAJ8051337.1 Vps16, C-terminal region-domain-containing protein [Yarrowia lipolytica]RMI97002.1 Vps16, C-terminal region-domain-containing protein [Yarrowia lipolytica]